MNVRTRLLWSLGALSFLMLLLGVAGLYSVRVLGRKLNEATNLTGRKTILFGEVKSGIYEQQLAIRNCLNDAQSTRPAAVAEHARRFQDLARETESELAQIRPLLMTERGRAVLAALASQFEAFQSAARQILELLPQGQATQAARIAEENLTPAANRMMTQIAAFLRVQDNYVRQESEDSASAVAALTWLCAVLLLAGLGLAGFVVRTILRLSRELNSLGHDLLHSADEVSNAVAQVAEASVSLAQGASEQAAAIEEVSSAMEEITAVAGQNTQAAGESASLMSNAQQTGGKVREAMEALAAAVGEINGSNAQISRILHAIEEIAFQTNILALNAAVEAARAGVAGAGFAVVADEVRSLAQRCSQAAQETSQFVAKNSAAAREGLARLEAVRSTWKQSGELRDRVKSLSDGIAGNSAEQTRGVAEISKAILQLNAATQGAASKAEETSAASEELTGHVRSMHSVAEHLYALMGN